MAVESEEVKQGSIATPVDSGPPMTASLMGRLFVVPAIIVCVLLGVVVVVVLFGATTLDRPQTTEELIARIESDSGDRSLGVLFPTAKEPWLAAQELAVRLQKKDEFIKPGEIEPFTDRIAGILEKSSSDSGEQGVNRTTFLIIAMARLGHPKSIPVLEGYLKSNDPRIRRAALMGLAEMGPTDVAQRALPAIYSLLDDADDAVRMVACLTVASIADPGDPTAISELAAKLETDRETQWNAATALARLGSSRGKLVLLNMLDRPFWEDMALSYDEDGSHVSRKLSQNEVADRLVAAIGAASYLHDPALVDQLQKLSDDPVASVRNAAEQGLKKMKQASEPSSQAGGPQKQEMLASACGFTAEGPPEAGKLCATSIGEVC